MDEVVHALSQSRRREILRMVRDREMSAGEIAAQFDVSRPAISQHIKVLRETGLVAERKEGTRRLYRARPEGLAELRRYLDLFWDYRLQMLKEEVESGERGDAPIGVEEQGIG